MAKVVSRPKDDRVEGGDASRQSDPQPPGSLGETQSDSSGRCIQPRFLQLTLHLGAKKKGKKRKKRNPECLEEAICSPNGTVKDQSEAETLKLVSPTTRLFSTPPTHPPTRPNTHTHNVPRTTEKLGFVCERLRPVRGKRAQLLRKGGFV